MKQTSLSLKKIYPLLSPVLLLLAHFLVFRLFQVYVWGFPLVKLGCFVWIALVILWLHRNKAPIYPAQNDYWIETILFGGILVFSLAYGFLHYSSWLFKPPRWDIGIMTQKAAVIFFRDGGNPYQSQTMPIYAQDPSFSGFKYGPFVFMGYFLSSIFLSSGYKFMSLIYLGLSGGLLALLSIDRQRPKTENISAIIFVLALFFLPEIIWFELFQQGVNDIFPVFLLLAGLVFLRNGALFPAGLAAGLSFSAKFMPAVFFILLFFRRDIRWTFFAGALAGMAPIIAFLFWDPGSFIANAVQFHIVKNYDSSSLYHITPQTLHFLFPLGQVAAIFFMVARNYNKRLDFKKLTVHFTLLTIIVGVLYKEVHNNYLNFFIPFAALIFGWYRYKLLPFRACGEEEKC